MLEKANVARLAGGAGADADALCVMSDKLRAADNEIISLSMKVNSLEEINTSLSASSLSAPFGSADVLRELTNKLSKIMNRSVDAENRLRRSNFLFFGLEDDPNENWAVSEDKIVKFCSDHLGISISSQLERVDRLGRFNKDKRRRIIAKITFFKDKEIILSNA